MHFDVQIMHFDLHVMHFDVNMMHFDRIDLIVVGKSFFKDLRRNLNTVEHLLTPMSSCDIHFSVIPPQNYLHQNGSFRSLCFRRK